jgi:hypothetical protein
VDPVPDVHVLPDAMPYLYTDCQDKMAQPRIETSQARRTPDRSRAYVHRHLDFRKKSEK